VAELRCPYFPPLFVGTERERRPETVRALGFSGTQHIEGMDFPANSVGSVYLGEETFALVVCDTLNVLFDRFRSVAVVDGHAAENQSAVLNRLCAEMNAPRTGLMWVYPGFPRSLIAGSIGHATAAECSMLDATWPGCVDLSRLPSSGPLRNVEFAIVDGDTFDGKPTPDFTVREREDPRRHTDPAEGRRFMEEAVVEVIAEIRGKLLLR
jgi:creatinine amidohydrolase/Fe(II)-dependent formamide hydrolase-like protein